MSPNEAAQDVMKRIVKKYPKAQAALVVADAKGNYGLVYFVKVSLSPFSLYCHLKQSQLLLLHPYNSSI